MYICIYVYVYVTKGRLTLVLGAWLRSAIKRGVHRRPSQQPLAGIESAKHFCDTQFYLFFIVFGFCMIDRLYNVVAVLNKYSLVFLFV